MAESKAKPANGAVVAVFGSSHGLPGEADYDVAVEVGRTLAEMGYSVATGGYGGLMEAASRGAASAGSEVIGVTCRLWPNPNAYLTRAIETGDIFDRVKGLIDVASAGFVALPGGTGTLLEVATAWEMIAKNMLDQRPIVCLGDTWKPLLPMILPVQPNAARYLRFIDSPTQLRECFGTI